MHPFHYAFIAVFIVTTLDPSKTFANRSLKEDGTFGHPLTLRLMIGMPWTLR